MSHYEPSSQSSLDLCTTPNTHVPVRVVRRPVPARGALTTKPDHILDITGGILKIQRLLHE